MRRSGTDGARPTDHAATAAESGAWVVSAIARFLLSHRHEPSECRFAYAAWRGFDSPLRRRPALSSCTDGGHRLWWVVEAPDAAAALGQLPTFIADRTDVTAVRSVPIP